MHEFTTEQLAEIAGTITEVCGLRGLDEATSVDIAGDVIERLAELETGPQ